MTTSTNLGIWMDHSNAHLMEFTTDPITTTIISSRFAHQEREHSIGKSENGMHQKEQHEQKDYYRKIGEAIKDYQHIVLFGPTEAKMELFNILQADRHFAKIKIETRDADKMTQNEQHAFVKKYFSHQ
jgi:stalled ribosome rescue protein Dom34